MKKVERASQISVSSEPVVVCRHLGIHTWDNAFFNLLIRERLLLHTTLNNIVFECFPVSVLVDSIYYLPYSHTELPWVSQTCCFIEQPECASFLS